MAGKVKKIKKALKKWNEDSSETLVPATKRLIKSVKKTLKKK